MLALWEYFWEESDWTGATPSTTTTTDPGAGGGKRKNRHYQRAGDDFWLVRERYLRRFVTPLVSGQPANQKGKDSRQPANVQPDDGKAIESGRLLLLEQARESALLRARAANNAMELLALSARIRQLTLDINVERQQNYERAIAILLLDIF